MTQHSRIAAHAVAISCERCELRPAETEARNVHTWGKLLLCLPCDGDYAEIAAAHEESLLC
jgi:hypothetical protein